MSSFLKEKIYQEGIFCIKKPDYIVIFEESRIKKISLEADKDFNIPIVKINREKCEENE